MRPLDAAGFDRWQPDYDAAVRACDEAGDYPFAGYRELMEQMLNLLNARPGMRILELGCGTGHLAAALAARGHTVTAVDFSEQMLAAARKRAPGVRFFQSELPMLPEAVLREQFDLIAAAYSLHHLADAQKYAFLRKLRGCLAPEGAIVIGDVAFLDRSMLNDCREAYQDEWDDGEYYFVEEELQQALPEYHLDCIPISFCADVLILTPEEA